MTDRVTTQHWNQQILVGARERGSDLLAQIAWFNRLRFFAVAGILVTTVLAQLLGILERVVPLYLLAGLTLVVNLGYRVTSRRLPKVPSASVRRHVDLQIGVDLAVLTLILHFTGGVTTPLVLFYLFHAFIAALLLSLRAAVWVALACLLLMATLGYGEYYGWLEHHPLRWQLIDLRSITPQGLTLWLLGLGVVLGFSIYFVATVVRQLSNREAMLVGLSRQLAQSEKLASIGTLAAGVSHEINNPVSVIQNKTQILRYRIQDGDPSGQLLAELNTIEKHTRRIGAITEGLLAFAREAPFELRPVAVNDLVREAADLCRVPFKTANVGLNLRLDPSDPQVPGSPNHLLQVLVNILLNARDASRGGSAVALSAGSGEQGVRLQIADSGVGIAEEHLGKIFDPFFTTKDVDRGTGLGLALSHTIVDRHHGRITVESQVGEGTTFTIVLPAAPEPS